MERILTNVLYVVVLTFEALFTIVCFVSSIQDAGFGNQHDSTIELWLGVICLAAFIGLALAVITDIVSHVRFEQAYDADWDDEEDDENLAAEMFYMELESSSSTATHPYNAL